MAYCFYAPFFILKADHFFRYGEVCNDAKSAFIEPSK